MRVKIKDPMLNIYGASIISEVVRKPLLILLFSYILTISRAQGLSETCKSGGVYDDDTGKCICSLGYWGTRCQFAKCEHGSGFNNGTRDCSCVSGRIGIRCTQCSDDSVCTIPGDKCQVNMPIRSLEGLSAQCKISQPSMANLFGQIFHVSTPLPNIQGNLFMQGYKISPATGVLSKVVNCAFSRCKVETVSDLQGVIHDKILCFDTNCACDEGNGTDSGCNRYIRDYIKAFKGASNIDCKHGNADGDCNIEFSSPEMNIKTACRTSRCGSQRDPSKTGPKQPGDLKFIKWIEDIVKEWWVVILFDACVIGLLLISLTMINIVQLITAKRYASRKTIMTIQMYITRAWYKVYAWMGFLERYCATMKYYRVKVHINDKGGTGGITLVSGINNAGKTTLIRVLSGILANGVGYQKTITVSGASGDIHKLHGNIGVCYNTEEICSTSTVREYLILIAVLAGHGRRIASVKTIKIAEDLGISHCLDSRCSQLGTGYTKMLHIAAVIMRSCKVRVLDEPFNGLSTGLRNKLWKYIKKTRKHYYYIIVEHGITKSQFQDINELVVIKGCNDTIYGPVNTVISSFDETIKINGDCTQYQKYKNILNFLQRKSEQKDINISASKLLSKDGDDNGKLDGYKKVKSSEDIDSNLTSNSDMNILNVVDDLENTLND